MYNKLLVASSVILTGLHAGARGSDGVYVSDLRWLGVQGSTGAWRLRFHFFAIWRLEVALKVFELFSCFTTFRVSLTLEPQTRSPKAQTLAHKA